MTGKANNDRSPVNNSWGGKVENKPPRGYRLPDYFLLGAHPIDYTPDDHGFSTCRVATSIEQAIRMEKKRQG